MKNKHSWTAKEEPLEITRREQEELQVLENLVATMQKKIENARWKIGANKSDGEGLLTWSKAQVAQQEKETQAQSGEKSMWPDPQYWYVMPIKDPSLVKKLVQQSLDSKSPYQQENFYPWHQISDAKLKTN